MDFRDRTAAPKFGVSSDRRRWITCLAIGIGGLAIRTPEAWGAVGDGLSHSAEAIHQEPAFKANPKLVYEALTDAKQFQRIQLLGGAIATAELEAKPAQISRETGGAFNLFGGYIVGRQLELVPNQRIVEAWRETTWDSGIYSVVRFEMREQGVGTRLIFDHTGFPAGAGEHLAVGWKANYWDPLEKLLS